VFPWFCCIASGSVIGANQKERNATDCGDGEDCPFHNAVVLVGTDRV
jgi:hypothetical protein